jgi:SAM-dependent methyltransferase
MTQKPAPFDPSDPEQTEKRAAARKRLDSIDPAKQGAELQDPNRREWFEAVYALSEGDAVNVPWGNLVANPLLLDWLAQNPGLRGLSALDIGCGLGDNAVALAKRGAAVTAFDFVPRAVEWARERFPNDGIAFIVADLFAPPAEWREAFDFVHETYTLQALPAERLPAIRTALADFVKPGGRLLVIARAREEDWRQTDGPPWPLACSDIEAFTQCGLTLEKLENPPSPQTGVRHWRALLRKRG